MGRSSLESRIEHFGICLICFDATVTNRPKWNPAWMNSGLSNSDSTTHKYCRGGFSDRGLDEPSPGWYPPTALSPWDRGLVGDALGNSCGSGLEEALAGLGLEVARRGEDIAPPAPGEFCVPPRLGGFRDSCAVSLVLRVGGLVTIGDSPPTRALLVEESGLIY
jgi:hypothetical protein